MMMQESEISNVPEEETAPELQSETQVLHQRADDVAMTQCILCILLVLILFVLHWLKPEWQSMLLQQYIQYRNAPPLQWLDQLLHSIQQWMQR